MHATVLATQTSSISTRYLATSLDLEQIAQRTQRGVTLNGELVDNTSDAYDFEIVGARLVITSATGTRLFDFEGALQGELSLGLNGRLFRGRLGAVAVCGMRPAIIETQTGHAREIRISSNEILIGFLGGARVLTSIGGATNIVDAGLASKPLGLFKDVTHAMEILGGGAIALVGRSSTGTTLEVTKPTGDRIRRMTFPAGGHVVCSMRGERALVQFEDELVVANIRLGRIEQSIKWPRVLLGVGLRSDGERIAIVEDSDESSQPQVRTIEVSELAQERKTSVAEKSRAENRPIELLPSRRPRRRRDPLPNFELKALARNHREQIEPNCAEPYAEPIDHLEALVRLSEALAALAIARACDRGTLVESPIGHSIEDEVDAILEPSPGLATDRLEREQVRYDRLRFEITRRSEATYSSKSHLPLVEIAENFGLTEEAVDILVAVSAPALSSKVARLYGILANDAARPLCDRALIEDLLGTDSKARTRVLSELDPGSPLVSSGLVRVAAQGSPLFAALEPSSAVLDRLRGRTICASRVTGLSLVDATSPLENLSLPYESVVETLSALRDAQPRARLSVCAPRGLGGTTLLSAVARRAGRQVARVDVELLPPDNTVSSLANALTRTRVYGAIPCIAGLETISDIAEKARVSSLLDEVQGPVFFREVDAHGFCAHAVRVVLPSPTESERAAAWQDLAKRAGHPLKRDESEALARRFVVGPGVMSRICETINTQTREHLIGSISEAVRRRTQTKLSGLAEHVTRLPKWSDVVLPRETEAAIRELVSRARNRRRVFDDWGFEERLRSARGLTALFSGQPGTGKTLAAGLIARELELELYRVDVAKITSKWLGETQKNLSKIFDAAAEDHSVLLFDEADSLFAKRGAVKSSNDKHSNMEINYLLQRLDSFEGVAVLTTNLASSIDPAFKRRLTMEVGFEMPDEVTRARIWQAHLPTSLPVDDALDLASIAKKYNMSGGYIRNALLRAAFLAATDNTALTNAHVEEAVLREYYDRGRIGAQGALI